LGYSEDDAQLMEKLQNDIKKYCDGNNETLIKLDGGDTSIVTHHDMMLPHWKKLFKALRGRTSVDEVFISAITLPISILDIMFPTFQSMNLNHIVLSYTRLGVEGLLRLTYFVKDNASLKHLTIGGEAINLAIATSLSNALNNHPTLERITLLKCGLDNAALLTTILRGCKGLHKVRICVEEFGPDSIGVLAEFISCNHPIECIDLGFNNISNRDTVVLASALKENTNLKWLNLKKNDITEEGDKNLLKAVFDPTSMDSIVNSNHVCRAYTYDINSISAIAERPLSEREVHVINANNDMSIQQKIRKKVVLALCEFDGSLFDLSHFNDLPLQLMPRVLELIQKHSQSRKKAVISNPLQLEKDALSRLFHTLRGWELPLLFENLNNPSVNVTTGRRKRRKTRR